MKNQIFKGTGTAIVTPFHKDGTIDYDAFKKLLDFQIKNKVEAIIVCGSTGESATLTVKEKLSLIIQAVEYSAGRVPIIAGTGSNSTQASIDLSLVAKEHGADAILLVGPYYNKPTQEGLYYHYKTIADAVDIPQIIYNVPGRTAMNIQPETQLKLAEDCPNIVASKEASGNLEQMMEIVHNAPEGFMLYSGDDALTLPIIASGGSGVISVISNYAPKQYGDLVRFALKGKFDKAREIQKHLFEMMKLNFVESNPVPVKAILNIMGMIEEQVRLPLVPLTEGNKKLIEYEMKNVGLIK